MLHVTKWLPFHSRICVLIVLMLHVCAQGGVSAEEIDFGRDIEPILESNCWGCHSEDEQESGLRLDRRASLLKGGDSGLAALVPGEPEDSYLIDVVKHLDADFKMPPDEDQIPAEQIELLERWVKMGAPWPGQMKDVITEQTDLWSFQPIVRPDVPSIQLTGNSDGMHPIDSFLLKSLQRLNLDYSKPANPRDLLRRVSITLTGLLPTPAEIEQFSKAYQNDASKAYVAVVDRMLQSPHFGERWAQHWLDVIRWAETNGSESNLYRKNAWIYRDYVIRSFNDDKPYNQFLLEQIAGDSLGIGEAMGFLVAGPHVPAATVGREPSAIRQARSDRMDEVIQTVGASVLGVTMGCARCHNHKFDPITLSDYYAMTAVFQDVEFGSRHPEYHSDHPLQQRGDELREQIDVRRQKLQQFGGWEENWGAYREMHFSPVETNSVRIRFKMANLGIDEIEVFGPDQDRQNLALASTGTRVSGYPEKGFETRNPLQRVSDGEFGTMTWRARVEKNDERPWVQFDFPKPEVISRLRLSSNREYFYETDYLERKPSLPRYEYELEILQANGEWKTWVGTWAVNKKLPEKHPEREMYLGEIQKLIRALAEEGPRPGFVGRFVEPVVTRVLSRGSPENPRDEVYPAGPKILDGDFGMTSQSSGSERRLAFGRWVTRPEHPLTRRVLVNRLWHHLFGQGLVPTTGDFGNAGALPSNPELLDWLAAEFIDPTVSEGPAWSIKSMVRLIVLSDAFQQSSQPNEKGLAVDAGSQRLWRYPPRRVEAEVIRDAILKAAGNLDPSIGGRSYRIHNVKKTYAQWEVVDNFGPETWRRMIYQERMRRVDDQLFTAFDFPDCGQVRAKRPVSTTPLQALNLMNSDFVIDQSRQIAQRAMEEAGDADQAVSKCFELLLGRQLKANEREQYRDFTGLDDLALVCRAIINSNEFAFLP